MPAHKPIAIHQKGFRYVGNPPVIGDATGLIDGVAGIGIAFAFQEIQRGRHFVLIRHTPHRDFGGLELQQHRVLNDARLRPGCPEVHQQRFAAIEDVSRLKSFTTQARQAKSGDAATA